MQEIIFSLVMPVYNCNSTIKKALDSILDQDLEAWELICVINGKWEKQEVTERIIKQYSKKDSRISYLVMEEGNVCKARNLGAANSKGKYISFFSSDFMMYPGALTKWKANFEKYPEADFIYSGYELMENGKTGVGFAPSREFDPYLLEVNNYIDGGFPMKREVWEKGKWDKDIKSLNDWDFWLTAVKNGFKGKFVLDPTYAAEVPKQGGLSYDSHNNWLDRMSQIKKKHKIPERDICVVSLGAQPHGIRLAKMLNADFQVAPQMKPNKYKAIYLVGFYIGNGESALAHANVFREFNGKQLIHWIGTDVLQLVQAGNKVVYNSMKELVESLQRRTNLSEFEQTQGELKAMGIDSQIVPLPIEQNIEVMPLPKQFTVAVYVPNTPTAKHIYNLEFTRDIIKACPDINFLLFGGGTIEGVGANVKVVGWSPMKTVLEQSSMLMRLAFHDGMPVAPIEFVLAGRDAMTTVQMPYIYYAGDGFVTKDNYSKKKEAIIDMIRSIKKDQKKNGGPKELTVARKHYLKLTDPKEYKATIRKIIDG